MIRVIGSADKIRFHAEKIGKPQQCDIQVKDIQDGSSLGRLRMTFKLHCIGLSKVPKEISLQQVVISRSYLILQTVNQPPLESVPNSNSNSSLAHQNFNSSVTASNGQSPKPKPPTKTTTPQDMPLRTYALRNHHCEVCLPEDMRKDLHEGGKQFWDQLFTQILKDGIFL